MSTSPVREEQGSANVWPLDIARASADVGFNPEFDIVSGVADYVDWLRAGHER